MNLEKLYTSPYRSFNGNYGIRGPVRIMKIDIPYLIDLLISINFSSMTFFCATRILRVIIRQSYYSLISL